uniref:AlkB homolog 4, lysine demethylase n=1 Tax=Coturnix japonica TaxID=93934 RepID=A0A8C2TBQ4_COTJA
MLTHTHTHTQALDARRAAQGQRFVRGYHTAARGKTKRQRPNRAGQPRAAPGRVWLRTRFPLPAAPCSAMARPGPALLPTRRLGPEPPPHYISQRPPRCTTALKGPGGAARDAGKARPPPSPAARPAPSPRATSPAAGRAEREERDGERTGRRTAGRMDEEEAERGGSGPGCGCKGIRSCLLCEGPAPPTQGDDHFTYCPSTGLAEGNESSPFAGWAFPFPGVFVMEEFVSEDEEAEMVEVMDRDEWKPSQSGRKKQDYGPKVNFKKQRLKAGCFTGLPSFSKKIVAQMEACSVLGGFLPVEQCNLDYRPERGSAIDPHFDDWWLWGERLVSLNLLSKTVLSMSCDSEDSIQLFPTFSNENGELNPPGSLTQNSGKQGCSCLLSSRLVPSISSIGECVSPSGSCLQSSELEESTRSWVKNCWRLLFPFEEHRCDQQRAAGIVS